MKKPLPKLAAYLRVSSQNQKNEETIYRQIDVFNQAWERLKDQYELLPRFPFLDQTRNENRLFIDEGYNLEQWDPESACNDLMSRCQRGEVRAVFISEVDRLCRSRSAELRGRIKDILDGHGIKIFTKNGEAPSGMLFEFLSSLSAEDKRGLMTKLHEAKITRAENEGRSPSGSKLFGYDWDKLDKKWKIVPEEKKIIHCAIGLVLGKPNEHMPPQLIALAHQNPMGLPDVKVIEALNASGFNMKAYYERNHFRRSLKNNPEGKLNSNFLSTLFREDRYCGSFKVYLKAPHQVGRAEFKNLEKEDKKEITIALPPIITDSKDWKAIKEIRASRQVRSTRNVSHDYLVKDLLICSVCGIKLSARPKWGRGGKPTLYYVCARRLKVSGFRCSANRCHSAPKLDGLVWEEVQQFILNPDKLLRLKASTQDWTAPASAEPYEQNYQDLGQKLLELSKQREYLTTLLVQRKINDADFNLQRNRIETETRGLEKLRRSVLKQIESAKRLLIERPVIDLEAIVRNVKGRLQTLTFREKREIVLLMVNAILIGPDGKIKMKINSLPSHVSSFAPAPSPEAPVKNAYI